MGNDKNVRFLLEGVGRGGSDAGKGEQEFPSPKLELILYFWSKSRKSIEEENWGGDIAY